MKINEETILSLLLTCKNMTQLKQLHGVMLISSVMRSTIHASKIIDFCTDEKTGEQNLEYARSVFEGIAEPSLYIWNSMMRGYSNGDSPAEALITYRRLLRKSFSPDHFSFPFVLKACSAISDFNFGTSVHNRVMKTGFGLGVHTSTALLHMYARCGDIDSGLKVFDDTPKWSVVAWATLISGLVNNDRAGEAVRAFRRMAALGIEPNEISTVNALVACARTGDIETGKRAHSLVNALGRDPFSGSGDFNLILASAIIDMYAKCGTLKTARELFDRMPVRNSVAWNSMIGAYSKHGRPRESLELFREMKIFEPVTDQATFVVAAGACANLENPSLGQSVHACAEKTRSRDDLTLGTTLVYMYAKTGDLRSARRVFDSLRNKDVEAWTTLILGLARHGHGSEALTAFESMKRDSHLPPDRITYIGVLSACGAAGLVEPGLGYFEEMRRVYGLVPEQEHYSCVVDLLSRAGRFEDAVRFVEDMPFEPNAVVWGALLNGCEIHENVQLANRVRERLNELQPRGSGVYVLLSNIYARATNWHAVNLARDLMTQRHITKTPGLSMLPETPR